MPIEKSESLDLGFSRQYTVNIGLMVKMKGGFVDVIRKVTFASHRQRADNINSNLETLCNERWSLSRSFYQTESS